MSFLSRAFGHKEKRGGVSVVPTDLWRSVVHNGTSVTPENSLQVVAVFACVRVIAESIAALPLIVYERQPNGGKRRADNFYLYDILHNAPNSEMDAMVFWETMIGHVALRGNAYAYIDWGNDGRVNELWPLRPDRVWVRRNESYNLEYLVQLPNGENRKLLNWQMLHIRGLSFDGLIGYSPIEVAKRSVRLAMATEEYGAKFFDNDARPGGVLQHPGRLSDEAFNNLRESWEAAHSGLDNAHKPAILEEGMTFHEIGLAPEHAQFLETRRFSVEEIARLFRVPPHKIGALERATFSNIEHQSLDFVTDTLRPWFVRLEKAIFRSLLLESEQKRYFVEFLADALLRGDIESRYKAYAIGRQNGFLSANDIRKWENLNPVDGGDVYLVPLNMIPADQAAKMPESNERQEARGETRVDPVPKEQRAAGAARHRLMEQTLPILERELDEIIRQEVNELKTELENRLDPNEAWIDGWYAQFRDAVVVPKMLRVLVTYSDILAPLVASELGVDETPDLARFVQSYVESYGRRHVANHLARLRATDNYDELFTELDSWPERLPAQTAREEAVRSNNAFAKAAYVALGVQKLRWVAFGDNCPYCKALNGKVVGIQQFFILAGEGFEPDGAERPLMPAYNIGHAPAHGGCDCMVVAS